MIGLWTRKIFSLDIVYIGWKPLWLEWSLGPVKFGINLELRGLYDNHALMVDRINLDSLHPELLTWRSMPMKPSLRDVQDARTLVYWQISSCFLHLISFEAKKLNACFIFFTIFIFGFLNNWLLPCLPKAVEPSLHWPHTFGLFERKTTHIP